MKTLTSLTLVNLKQNRSRTVMTIIGIALSVALILACIGFGTSINYSERQDAVIRFGDYHVMYKDIPGDKVSIIEEHESFIVQFYSNPVGCVTTEYGFEDCDGMSPYRVEEYERIDNKNQLVRDSGHQYNVFVFYKDPTKADQSDRHLSHKLDDAGVRNVHHIKNNMVATIDGDVPDTSRILSFWLVFIFIGSMSIISAFIIRNSFNISITERVRQFGMLASIGARPRQIRRMVYEEGLIIGLIAIPIGMLLGCLATLGVVVITNSLIGFSEATDMLFYIPPSAFLYITLAGIFIVILSASSPAIVASRVSPIAALNNTQEIKVRAKKLKTSKLTQKLWGIGGVIASKNLKRSRSKYRTTVISIVLSISVFIGISSFMMYGHKVIEMLNEDTGANVMVSSDQDGVYDDLIKHFGIQKYARYSEYGIKSNEDDFYTGPKIKSVSRDEFVRYAKKAGIFSTDYKNLVLLHDMLKTMDHNGNYTVMRTTKYKVGDEIKFKAVSWEYDEDAPAECNPDDFHRDIPEEEMGEELTIIIDKCKDGELGLKGAYVEKVSEQKTLKITNIVDISPMGIYSYELDTRGMIYISEDNPIAIELKSFAKNGGMLYIADSGLGKDIETYLNDKETIEKYHKMFNTDNVFADTMDFEESQKTIRNAILLIEILIYGFIVIAALIGITNIFNTITTNVALRAKEFAMLKSIGMTDKEFNHMVRLESALYTTRALFIGLPIGLLMSYAAYKLFDAASIGYGFMVPWGSIVICVIVVAVLVAVIMRYSVRKIKKQNIIETIRTDSI